MGWKLSSIIIKNPGNVTDEEVLDSLFDYELSLSVETIFSDCMHPIDEDRIYFANYQDCLIICTNISELVEKFFTKEISKAEKIFIELFPNSEIGAFSLQSTINYYAWTVISAGKKLRTKQGDEENGITCDVGEPLAEEKEFLNVSFKDKVGALKYNWKRKNGTIKVYSEDQIGEEYVSKIWARFTGKELFKDDELLDTIHFRTYETVYEDDDYDSDKKSFWRSLFGKK